MFIPCYSLWWRKILRWNNSDAAILKLLCQAQGRTQSCYSSTYNSNPNIHFYREHNLNKNKTVFLLRHLGHLPTTVLKLTVIVFTNRYFLWPNWLNFFWPLKKILVYDCKRRNQVYMQNTILRILPVVTFDKYILSISFFTKDLCGFLNSTLKVWKNKLCYE